ncbi:MAG: type VI secretion system tube protein Hcp [Pirellulales bacterium]|nr:type VI secretion system tube protein Hcp [Pirellulales bacterium]
MAGYVQIGDIKGESVDANHKDWINLISVSQSVSRPMRAGVSGSTRQRASADLGDIILVKEVDASTPKLIQAICDGTNYPEVKIDLCTSTGAESRQPYFQWVLKNVRVTNYDVSGATQEGAVPTEQISLNYEEIKWTYDKMDKSGKSVGKVEATWKVEEGQA